jgi:hypothetical protein
MEETGLGRHTWAGDYGEGGDAFSCCITPRKALYCVAVFLVIIVVECCSEFPFNSLHLMLKLGC